MGQEVKNFDGGNLNKFFISVCTTLYLLRLNYFLFSGGICGQRIFNELN